MKIIVRPIVDSVVNELTKTLKFENLKNSDGRGIKVGELPARLGLGAEFVSAMNGSQPIRLIGKKRKTQIPVMDAEERVADRRTCFSVLVSASGRTIRHADTDHPRGGQTLRGSAKNVME